MIDLDAIERDARDDLAPFPAYIVRDLIHELRALRGEVRALHGQKWPEKFGNQLVSVDIYQGHHGDTRGGVHDAVNIGEAITRMAEQIHPDETHVTIVARLIRRYPK